MQLSFLLVSVSMLAMVSAKGANKAQTTEGQCKQMNKLEKFVSFAANDTLVAAVTKNNATKIADIQAKASAASTTLATMQQNTTLTATCAVVNAAQATTDGCQETFALQRFIDFANNDTAVTAATKGNATKAADIQAKASQASTQLATLTSNSTLQAFCPAVMQADQCKAMNKLQKVVDTANNATKLDKATKGNATKAAAFQARASQAAIKLSTMTSNSTFMTACAALKTTKDGTASAAAASTTAKSAASALAGNVFLSTIVLVFAGIMML
ncbi:hypothetical protein BP5796_02801 [Coleophoma crateriformis]|uniref:Cell wall protein n=1 Tax=Coleophoma crateriformis TaxID=565419 RepID=A0A3D8SZB3_9HELO|nr:hypothetical protein BP5796_02801 [Coleophoma crateriformis]